MTILVSSIFILKQRKITQYHIVVVAAFSMGATEKSIIRKSKFHKTEQNFIFI